MPHWSEPYIDREYSDDFNCTALVEEVQCEVFNRYLVLPKAKGHSYRRWAAQIAQHKHEYAQRVIRPVDGDAVLMIGRGESSHVGVYAQLNGVPWVLHNVRRLGRVCFHRISDLSIHNFKIEGYYSWL